MTALTPLQEEFLRVARLKRQIVAEFAQNSSVEIKTYPVGFCAGLSVHWLALRAGGKNWPSPQSGAEAQALSAKAAATYGKYIGVMDKTKMSEYELTARVGASYLGGIDMPDISQVKMVLKDVLGSVGMSLDENSKTTLWKGGEGEKFIHEVSVLDSGFYYISIKCSKGSHALGLQIASKQHDSDCEFFDPNIGQLHYDTPTDLGWSFGGLMAAYVKIQGMAFTEGFAMRVNPPQLKFAP